MDRIEGSIIGDKNYSGQSNLKFTASICRRVIAYWATGSKIHQLTKTVSLTLEFPELQTTGAGENILTK